MKLAFVAPAYPYRGGISHFSVRLARELIPQNESLFINFTRLYPQILFPGKTQLDESSTAVEISSERQIDSINPSSWRRTGRRIREWGAEALVFHWWHPFFGPAYRTIVGSCGKTTRRIAICHNVLPHEKGIIWRKAIRFGLAKMDGCIVHSRSDEENLEGLFPGRASRVLFHPIYDIFPGEDISREAARDRLNLDRQSRIVLYFGLIRPYKGVEILLQACRELTDISRLKVLIVGEIYSGKDRIHELINVLPSGLVQLVDRYVPNEEVATWFRAADIVALPYLSATQSGIVPIAYRCLRPVIVTRVGGLPDVVSEGESGYIVEPDDPSGLAQAIRNYFEELGSPDLTEGIKAVSGRLSWSAYAENLLDFISELSHKA